MVNPKSAAADKMFISRGYGARAAGGGYGAAGDGDGAVGDEDGESDKLFIKLRRWNYNNGFIRPAGQLAPLNNK